MPMTDADRERIEGFIGYIEDSVATDDRFGAARRRETASPFSIATQFTEGRSCWFEVAVRGDRNEVRVGFFTTDGGINEDCEQAVAESGGTLQQFVADAFAEVGLDVHDPPVEHAREGDAWSFAGFLKLEDLSELDSDAVRDATLMMLDGFLLAFGPVLGGEDEEG